MRLIILFVLLSLLGNCFYQLKNFTKDDETETSWTEVKSESEIKEKKK